MARFLLKHWFLVCLVVLISGGLTAGAQSVTHIVRFSEVVNARVMTALVLFLMAFSLNSRQLTTAFRSPAPVMWASAINFGLIPLIGLGLMRLQSVPDFQIGLMIAASAPCTMAAASVWTRKAHGNDAVSMLVTVTTNGLCFLVMPFWLKWASSQSVELPVTEMMERLVYGAVVPMIAGQLLRQVPAAGRFATDYKTPIGVVAQACILTVVFSAACKAGGRLNAGGPTPDASSVLLVWGSAILLHLVGMGIGLFGARRFHFSWADQVAVAFAASQKTLPIGVLVATDVSMFGHPDLGIPFAVFPMLMYHASQLFIDTAIANRMAKQT